MLKSIVVVMAVLVGIFFPAILIAWFFSLAIRTHYGGIVVVSPTRLTAAVLIPLICGIRALHKQSLALSGVIAALLVGFILTIANSSFISSLLVFFFTSTKLTKFRAAKKAKQDEESSSGAQRNWLNVLNSGGVPTCLAVLYIIEAGCKETPVDFYNPNLYVSSWLSVAILGAIACACGDTWASEIGSAYGPGTARLITSGRVVPAGTNGGVSIVGTLSSVAGGLAVGLVFTTTSWIAASFSSFQSSLIWIGVFAGLFGSTIDSLLGATLQYSGFDEDRKKVVSKPGPSVKHISGVYLLSNHAVNLLSGCITSLAMPVVYQFVMSWF